MPTRHGARKFLCNAWYEDRQQHGPFSWAEENLNEVERNKRERRTVAWRYTVLRLHEVVQEIVPHLSDQDRERFKNGLARVFIDNYAAIPPQSIRRLLALREAGIISVAALGDDYTLNAPETVRGRIAFGAIPWLMHDHPFVQGLAECAEIAEAMARAAEKPSTGLRRRLPYVEN